MRRGLLVLILGASAIVPAVTSHWGSIGYAQTTSSIQGDEFNSTNFTAPFVVQCAPQATSPCPDNQSPTTWSLDNAAPGFLRIDTLPGTLIGQTTNNARNLVLQTVPNPNDDYTVTTSLTFPGAGSPAANAIGQTAGLLVYQDPDNFIYLGRSFRSSNSGLPQIEFVQESAGVDLSNAVTELASQPHSTVYLRLVKTGSLYQAYYSYDNVNFTQLAPGLAPTPVPTSTNTPTATSTATATATGTVTATDTPTNTATAVPTNTATPLPTGYTASYAGPRVGLFAWGGTDANASSNVIPADFDWFRLGSNSQTPVPTATGTPATATATSTATATGTAVPATATSTATATATATSTPVPPTATSTPVPPAPTNTPKPAKTATPQFGFSYTSVWYHYIKIGTQQHLQAQAKIHSKQGIWVTITFASGKKIHFWTVTNDGGFWQANVTIPFHTIAAPGPHSHRAWVTFQLWKGSLTTKSYKPFDVIHP